ncbi:threonine ammonia-lyase [Actinokineospora bangkokensis]|uniref:Pyridoxal-5'-phosphate-dependent protein subunit beta n=1 Tax=Actinokineospora bangkokensis TaxID=1193682 RepID=A0A1Q9LM03_9PSEU|nr:pyridoxal-phosphate dependent enzyme [Actinokineospora bangkokensis]OLR93062.1 pyridoxal-5'-phosphate-dependent protein subunit beta [Actinokineospora bangkokensis]
MTTAGLELGFAAVLSAAARIAGRVHRTPLLPLPGTRLLVKAEHRQRGGSFKARGAANALLGLGAAEVVTGSSGNHGIAVAALGGALGVRVTVVMAAGASQAKADALRALGAGVVGVAGGVAERDEHAKALAAATGAVFVPSSDHELVVAGAGTVGLEVFTDEPDLSAVYVPTGGGGLLAGVCLAAGALTRPVAVIGVEPAGAARYAASLAAGAPVELPPSTTVADGLRGQRPGAVTWPVIRDRVDELVAVTDDEVRAAQELLLAAGAPVEPSGAVALAGALRHPRPGRAAVIASGGNTALALSAIGAAATPPGRKART